MKQDSLAGRGLTPLDPQDDLLSFTHDAAIFAIPSDVGLTDLDTDRSVLSWLAANANAALGESALVSLSPPADRPYRRVIPPATSGLFDRSGPPAEV